MQDKLILQLFIVTPFAQTPQKENRCFRFKWCTVLGDSSKICSLYADLSTLIMPSFAVKSTDSSSIFLKYFGSLYYEKMTYSKK
jgi:hypothetical protein